MFLDVALLSRHITLMGNVMTKAICGNGSITQMMDLNREFQQLKEKFYQTWLRLHDMLSATIAGFVLAAGLVFVKEYNRLWLNDPTTVQDLILLCLASLSIGGAAGIAFYRFFHPDELLLLNFSEEPDREIMQEFRKAIKSWRRWIYLCIALGIWGELTYHWILLPLLRTISLLKRERLISLSTESDPQDLRD